MGFFKSKSKGVYKLDMLSQAEKSAVIQAFDLSMMAPVQAGLKGASLKNARCVGNYTYQQLDTAKQHVQANALNEDDVKTVCFVLNASSFAVGELVKKKKGEVARLPKQIAGQQIAETAMWQSTQRNMKTAREKVESLLTKQDNSWQSF